MLENVNVWKYGQIYNSVTAVMKLKMTFIQVLEYTRDLNICNLYYFKPPLYSILLAL